MAAVELRAIPLLPYNFPSVLLHVSPLPLSLSLSLSFCFVLPVPCPFPPPHLHAIALVLAASVLRCVGREAHTYLPAHHAHAWPYEVGALLLLLPVLYKLHIPVPALPHSFTFGLLANSRAFDENN